MSTRARLILAVILAGLVLTGVLWRFPELRERPLVLCPEGAQCRHIYDRAGVLPAAEVPKFEQNMHWIRQESDIDVRFVFLPDSAGQPLEDLAVRVVDQLRIGGRNRDQRGVLFLFDMKAKRLKIEVGYGLEGTLPDLFVSYLVDHHARMFFESGDLSMGLRLILRLLQFRIREAVLGDDFDPRSLGAQPIQGYLSGGAGISASMTEKGAGRRTLSEAQRAAFPAGASVAESFHSYVAWLSQPVFDPRIDVLDEPSRRYLAGLPISPAYAEYLRMGEVGKRFTIVERGDLAILYFTSTPFTSPHFFRRRDGLWRLDIVAEVRNTQEIVGGEFTWLYRGTDDDFTRTFADLLVEIRGYRRFRDGDNRPLKVSYSKPGAR